MPAGFFGMDRLLQLLPDRRQTIWVRYSVTAAMALGSIAVFSALQMESGFVGLFVLLPAIFLAGLLFDRGSGFLATAIELAAVLWVTATRDVSRFVLPVLLFIFIAFAFAVMAEAIRKELDKVAAAGRAKDLLLRELVHRTKNNLAMLSATVRLESRRIQPESRAAFEETSQRIQVMSEVYDHMMLRNDVKLVDVSQCLQNICQKLSSSISGPVGIRCEADPLYLSSDAALPIAIIANELITNSLKYAFPEGRAGLIVVELRTNGTITLSVCDNGVGMPEEKSEGTGSRILALLTQQLDGVMRLERLHHGTKSVLEMPKPSIEQT